MCLQSIILEGPTYISGKNGVSCLAYSPIGMSTNPSRVRDGSTLPTFVPNLINYHNTYFAIQALLYSKLDLVGRVNATAVVQSRRCSCIKKEKQPTDFNAMFLSAPSVRRSNTSQYKFGHGTLVTQTS